MFNNPSGNNAEAGLVTKAIGFWEGSRVRVHFNNTQVQILQNGAFEWSSDSSNKITQGARDNVEKHTKLKFIRRQTEKFVKIRLNSRDIASSNSSKYHMDKMKPLERHLTSLHVKNVVTCL